MKLGNNLRRCRFNKDEMTQQELASVIGVTRQTILSIEKGKFIPSTLLSLRLARFFEKPVEEIFYIIEENTNKGSRNHE
ncbi:MAG: helix-turn-helix transcriptional regulator [bacterium]